MRNRLFVAAAAALVLVLPAVGLAAARGTVLSTKLRGSAEAAKGSPTGSGTATITLDTKKSKACWTLSVHGIGKPLSAHVHKGPVGKAGPVVIPLGAGFTTKGCVSAPAKTLAAVAKKPGDYYVNVHTTKYLNGAIRGQLHG
jgi:hypothetical protein